MNAEPRPSHPVALTLEQRRQVLLARSAELRNRLSLECQDVWSGVSPPLDRVAALHGRLHRLWQGARALFVQRSWLLLAVPLGWRLLRRLVRRGRPVPKADAVSVFPIGDASPGAGPARLVGWLGRLSVGLRLWRMLMPLVLAWTDPDGRRRTR